MAQDHDEEMQEMMEEMAEDLEGTQLREKNLRQKKKGSVLTPRGQLLIYGGFGLLVLIILVLVFSEGGDEGTTKDLTALRGRLDRIENRLIQLESAGQKSESIENRVNGFEKSLSRLDRSLRAIREQVEKQSQKIAQVKKSAAPSASAKKSPSQTAGRYHEVVRGETLFRISKKYGVSVDELRRLNHLSKNEPIRPGQKIIVP